MDQADKILVLDGIEYWPYEYEKEWDIENDVMDNVKRIFGNNSILIPKLKIKPPEGSGRIPDMYVLTINPTKMYVTEVESIVHSIPDHAARSELIKKIYDHIERNSELKSLFENREIHKTITDVVQQSYTITLVIDHVTKELRKVFSNLKDLPLILEFKRYKRKNAEVYIHQFATLNKVDNPSKGVLLSPQRQLNSYNTTIGELSPGTKLYARYKGELLASEIVQDGSVKLKDGTIKRSLSGAAKYITKSSINGSAFWHYDEECKIPIRER